MKTLIIGTGAVGIGIGVSLQSEGFEVSFLAHGATGDALRKNGAERTGIFGDIRIKPGVINVYDNYDEIDDAFDFIIVSSKAMANEEIAGNINKNRRIMAKSCKLLIFQNGWGINDEYLKYFDEECIYNARIITGFERLQPWISKVTVHNAPILVGSLYGKDVNCVKPITDAINASKIPSDVTEVLTETLWAKMLFNTTLNPLGAILDVSYGEMAKSEHARKIMNKLIDETFAVINAEKYKTFWNGPEEYKEFFYSKLIPDTYEHRSSTLQDIEKKQKTEIDTLNGCIIRLAKKHDISVSTHEMIYDIIKSLEDEM